MMFHTVAFILGFLPVCVAGFFLLGRFYGTSVALGWLVACNLFFYAWWNPAHVPLLAASVLGNYAIAWKLRHTEATRAWLAAGVVANLVLLGWFKYADFLLQIAAPSAPALHITLPLAISFFTFQQIMFLVDTARGGAVHPSILPYSAFVTFFPHLIAGPIVRPGEIIPQLTAPDMIRPQHQNLADGALIFLLGLGKKLVLADMFGGFADIGFKAASQGASLTFFEAWYATLAYALQIYFDFSGYSDMAIGLARMLNIRFPLNFDSPYQATNIAEFWRRWHITLGGFLRDYLYTPLGGNRLGPLRQTGNLLATMLLCGLWHGAAWNFVLWGGLHGAFLVVHKQYRRLFGPLPAPIAQALTLFVVICAWVPFRAATVQASLAVLRGMAGLNGIALPRMIVAALPPLAAVADPVTVMPFLGDARTLSFPEISACLSSLAIYGLAFAFVLDRPLTLGALRARIEANLAYGATIHQPKLVILAGSNGPFSHRCETIAPMIGRPCVNAGVAVGVGLDYLCARWKRILQPGDMVYMPLEEAQYIRPHATNDLGPDAAIMLRHDRTTLLGLPLHRQIAALFASDLRAAVMSVLETALASNDFNDPRVATNGGYNEYGDHIGHTAAKAVLNQPTLAAISPFHPTGAQITAGYGSALVVAFLRWAEANGVTVIGGLPAGFIDSPLTPDELNAIRAVFRDHGAEFLETPEGDRYPRTAFFDSADHLNETSQISHSVAVAAALERLMGRKLVRSQ
jgi:alginate O-acetyltransferase complex protein AlgI